MPARGRAALILLLGALACGAESPVAPDAPNVLLITVDTLRADRLGTYGFPRDASPAVDALAAQGVVFERAISGSSSTAPSHAAIFTSRFTREHSIGHANGSTRLTGGVTLAEAFREAGYRTAAFVGNVVLGRRVGFDRGFGRYDDELPDAEANRQEIFERTAPGTSQRALAWLAEADDRPFFLWVHYQDPHGPYTPPAEFAARFPPQPRRGERPLPLLDGLAGRGGIPSYQVREGARLPSLYEARYAGEVAFADHWIGRLVAAVGAASGDAGVVVALTGDHGESLGEDDRWFLHGTSTAPDQAHVPLILRAPGLAPARRPEVVHHVDLLPTLLELAGLPVPADARGVALGPVLRGEAALPDRWVYCDDGATLSAYGPGGFVRVQGVAGAWPEADGGVLAPRWTAYRWLPDGSWSEDGPADGAMREPIRRYFRQAMPMADADPYSDTLREMLRTLGYGE